MQLTYVRFVTSIRHRGQEITTAKDADWDIEVVGPFVVINDKGTRHAPPTLTSVTNVRDAQIRDTTLLSEYSASSGQVTTHPEASTSQKVTRKR